MAKTISDSLVWTTEKRNAKSLVALPFNPRKLTDKQRRDLEASLSKFNLVEIPAINRDNTIIAGHQRLSILVALGQGDDEIDVRVPNRLLTEGEVKEYCIRSNKNTGEWDIDTLKENFDLNELLGWGFSQDEFRELGLEIPEFQPVSLDDQPRLDMKKAITCPNCHHEFVPTA
ncbi:MAG: hypothetical protein HY033_12205 [Ignavibacteriae bacterium]|nr:hypothetical protein [Ignavibacteria bacterium]MBI3365655.1 hypothetical protein [Ignavibacteriota bacterium]